MPANASASTAPPPPTAFTQNAAAAGTTTVSVWPIVAFVTLWLGAAWMIIGTWFHHVLPGGWGTVAAFAALLPFPVWRLGRAVRGETYLTGATRLFLLRPFWYAMLFLPVVAAGILAGGLAGLPFGSSGMLGRWSLALTGPVLAYIAIGGARDARRLVVKRLEVTMPRLPAQFDGLRIVQISDLHVGPHTSRAFLQRVNHAVQAEQPDLIAITGDQVDDFAEDVTPFNAAFASLRAPFGVFAVAGNHDIYAGWDAVRHGLEQAHFTVLVNEAHPLERNGARIWIAGTGDPAATSGPLQGAPHAAPDIERTLANVPPDEPVLVLAHNPALWPALAERGADLTLSGHTHYGQLALPRFGWSLASSFLKLAMGTHHRGRALLYIHPGTNYWGVPIRLGTPPEVAVLTLRSRPA